MSRLAVVTAGPLTSVQDGGRYGAQRYGLTTSGAMDLLALAAANTLVGNAAYAAAIEIGPFPASFEARHGAVRIALTGAARDITIGGRALPLDDDGDARTTASGWRSAPRAAASSACSASKAPFRASRCSAA